MAYKNDLITWKDRAERISYPKQYVYTAEIVLREESLSSRDLEDAIEVFRGVGSFTITKCEILPTKDCRRIP